jgi:uncharacterized protein YidB (DUF937 family)
MDGKIRAIAAGAGVLTLAAMLSTGIVLAQEDGSETPTATETVSPDEGDADEPQSGATDPGSERCMDFNARLAENLGISEEDLESAMTATQLELLDEAIADGDVDEEDAGAIREQIESGDQQICLGFGFNKHLSGAFEKPGFLPAFGLLSEPAAVAEFLGVDPAEVLEAFAGGDSLAELAEANGKTRDELKAYLTERVQARLDEAVANGMLEQQNADELIAEFEEHLDTLIDGNRSLLRGFAFPDGIIEGFPSQSLRGVASADLAEFLGASVEEVNEALAEGTSYAELAEANGKSRDELKQFLRDEFQAKVDERLAAGDIDADEAEELLARFESSLDDFIDAERFEAEIPGRGGRGEGPFRVPRMDGPSFEFRWPDSDEENDESGTESSFFQ